MVISYIATADQQAQNMKRGSGAETTLSQATNKPDTSLVTFGMGTPIKGFIPTPEDISEVEFWCVFRWEAEQTWVFKSMFAAEECTQMFIIITLNIKLDTESYCEGTYLWMQQNLGAQMLAKCLEVENFNN